MDINGIHIDVESGQLSVRIGARAMSEPRYLPKDPADVQSLVNAILHATGCRLVGNEVVNAEAYRAQLLDELARESVMSDDEYNADRKNEERLQRQQDALDAAGVDGWEL